LVSEFGPLFPYLFVEMPVTWLKGIISKFGGKGRKGCDKTEGVKCSILC